MNFFNNIAYEHLYIGLKNNEDKGLANFALTYGFTGNIIHKYIAYMLAFNENDFSILCENAGVISGDIKMVLNDIEEIYNLYNKDYTLTDILNFSIKREDSKTINYELLNIINTFDLKLEKSKNKEEFYNEIIDFYNKFGVGKLGLYKAFRLKDNGDIFPINNVSYQDFSNIIGYDEQKEKLMYNTESFLNGMYANNVLLYGDSGTGKSSSIKALIQKYYKNGLRIIEVFKHQMKDLSDLISKLNNRNYKFIIYMDDLSFEENEIEYKYLKSIIEGGLEAKPHNVLIYATSNRRHLIKETFNDNGGISDDLHRNETKAEKLSLASRFGLSILYDSPSTKEFKRIVLELAKRYKINMDEEILLLKASEWELHYGTLSGRTAEQFIKYISSGKNNF